MTEARQQMADNLKQLISEYGDARESCSRGGSHAVSRASDDYDEIIAAIDALVGVEATEGQWISTEDRLPEVREQAYLVATIARKPYADGSNYPGMGVRAINQDWAVRNYSSNFTHWMRLPSIAAGQASGVGN